MNSLARGLIVMLVLFVVWRAEIDAAIKALQAVTPPAPQPAAPSLPGAASTNARAWVSAVPANAMLPADRIFVGNFYESLGYVLGNEAEKEAQVLDTTVKFRRGHSLALDLAIEKAKVGKYPGLGEAIDRAFALAVVDFPAADIGDEAAVAKAIADGLTPRPVTKALRARLIDCCAALRWKLGINGE